MFLINKLLKWKGVPMEHELIDDLPEERIKVFETEAKAMSQFAYWKWFLEDMELLAERKMFKGDKELQTFGKGILYCLEMLKSNQRRMALGKIKEDSPEKKKMIRFIK